MPNANSQQKHTGKNACRLQAYIDKTKTDLKKSNHIALIVID